MKLGSVKYRKILRELDDAGVCININRVAPGRYEVYSNFNIAKVYKLRRSVNKYLLRIHKQKVTTSNTK